jgi:hypothetical protein
MDYIIIYIYILPIYKFINGCLTNYYSVTRDWQGIPGLPILVKNHVPGRVILAGRASAFSRFVGPFLKQAILMAQMCWHSKLCITQ